MIPSRDREIPENIFEVRSSLNTFKIISFLQRLWIPRVRLAKSKLTVPTFYVRGVYVLVAQAHLKLSFLGIRKETTRWAGGRRSRRRNFLTQSCCYKVPEQGVFIFILFSFFLPSPLGWIATLFFSFFHKYRTEALKFLLHFIGPIFARAFPFLFV